jgi:hypothetical protein
VTRLHAAVAALAFLAGGGRVLLPGSPHRYAVEYPWAGSCWCGKAKADEIHESGR